MKKILAIFLAGTMVFSFGACTNDTKESKNLVEELGLTAESKDATKQTVEINTMMKQN